MTIKEFSSTDLYKLLVSKEDFIDAWNESMLTSAFKSGRFFGFIAEENKKVIGFITLSKTVDDSDIESVFVYKEYRRKKVASSLMELAIKKVEEYNIKKIFLEVRVSNTSAISLYEKFGFKKISQRKKYYADGEDAFIYLKEI